MGFVVVFKGIDPEENGFFAKNIINIIYRNKKP